MKPIKVLFVCTGNTHRSPAAQLIAESLWSSNFIVDSAGISVRSAQSNPMSKKVIRVLEDMKYFVKEPFLRSKQVTASIILEQDYILCMQPSHVEYLETYFNKSSLLLLSSFGNPPKSKIKDFAFIPGCELELEVEYMIQCIKNFMVEVIQGTI